MTTNGSLKLYDIFRKDLHLPDSKAMEAVTALDDFSEKLASDRLESLATKDELLATRNELIVAKNELKQEIHTVGAKLNLMATKEELHSVATRLDLMATKEELTDVKCVLEKSILQTENRITKNIYGVTLAQMIILVTSVYYFLKFAGVVR